MTIVHCESGLDQVQRMQHQRRDHAARYTGNEMLVFHMAEHRSLGSPRRAAVRLYRRHFHGPWLLLLMVVRYRFSNGKSTRILCHVNNARLHSSAYLSIRERQTARFDRTARDTTEISPSTAPSFLPSFLSWSRSLFETITQQGGTSHAPNTHHTKHSTN